MTQPAVTCRRDHAASRRALQRSLTARRASDCSRRSRSSSLCSGGCQPPRRRRGAIAAAVAKSGRSSRRLPPCSGFYLPRPRLDTIMSLVSDTEMSKELRQRIRAVFLHPEESYPLREAARLVGVPVATLRREVRTGDRDARKERGAWRFTWRQVAFIAFDRWSLVEIHEALGADAASALPPLLALRTVTVQLPEFIVRALEITAADDETTVDDALHYELIEFAGCAADHLARRIPGFRQAYLYPG